MDNQKMRVFRVMKSYKSGFPCATGVRALVLALKADQASGGKNPQILLTLAAACAETEKFPNAVQTA